jgi:hypothetical protein
VYESQDVNSKTVLSCTQVKPVGTGRVLSGVGEIAYHTVPDIGGNAASYATCILITATL